MKVGIIASSLNSSRTGIGNYVYDLIEEINKINDKNNHIYLINYSKTPYFKNKNIIIRNPFPFFKTYAWHPYFALKSHLKDLDIIHNPNQIPTFFSFKQKYIITVHDITPFINKRESPFLTPLIYKLLFPRTLKTADKIIAISNNTKKDLIKYFNIPEEKIKVIYRSPNQRYKKLNNDKINHFKKKYHLNFKFILYVGTLEARKNIPTLLKAFHILKKKGIKHKLVLVGGLGWKYKPIFETIKFLNLKKDVIFPGYINSKDLPAIYNAADLFVYPSLYEGFGLPPLEAMACGTPVITSNTSSLPEVVGDAGLMFNPHDVKELADKMYLILTNKKLQKSLSEKGIKRARKFSLKKEAEQTLNLYKEVYKMKKRYEL